MYPHAPHVAADVRCVTNGMMTALTLIALHVLIAARGKWFFRGEKTVEKFCSWLISHQHRDVIAIAHYAHAYDAYFLCNYLLQQSIIPNIIFEG